MIDVSQLSDAEARKLIGALMQRFQYPMRPVTSPAAHFLAAIPLGESRLTAQHPQTYLMYANVKKSARRLLGDAGAKWTTRTTTVGIRVTRIA